MMFTECTTFSAEKENAVLQWEFKLHSALAAAIIWDLKGHMLHVKCQ